MDTPSSTDAVRETLSYHRRTKHHLHRYAASAGHLDWTNQPDPFRTYAGAPLLELPLLADALTARFGDLYVPGAVPARPLDIHSVAILFELSLGLSAWKEYQSSRWALRCNPSSGNLHPTEGYAIVPAVPGLNAGVYHYVSRDHVLEHRCEAPSAPLASALSPGYFLVGLTSIHWREAWKYGERAFRYCQHDVGHALAAIRYAAAALGWSAHLVDEAGDADVVGQLGLDRDEDFTGIDRLDREHPDALLLVGPGPLPLFPMFEPDRFRTGTWQGTPNRLNANHVRWEVIEGAATATWKPRTAPVPPYLPMAVPELTTNSPIPAARLIRQRRSCLALDGRTAFDLGAFYAMLDRTLPRPGVPPWDVLPWPPHLHLVLFVHRVQGLKPGLYSFERDPMIHEDLRAACRTDFLWQRVPDCPKHLSLYLLAEGDFREVSRTVSCHQEIASDGAFSLGMIAAFGETIRDGGAWWYRRLFWEAGILGQVLYLEAEAAGVRSTGIGCYFDDPFHELLGLTGDRFQDLYHFTVGAPVDDPRLKTIAPYGHLGR